eukprot:4577333-Pyramimonas_sp.AAC.1
MTWSLRLHSFSAATVANLRSVPWSPPGRARGQEGLPDAIEVEGDDDGDDEFLDRSAELRGRRA